MEVSGVTSAGSRIQTIGGKTLGKEEFMKLLLKQLSYQDPLNPMDSMQFTSQLTEFSSLEQLNNINSTLDDVLAFQQSMQNASISNMIGRTVTVAGDTAYLKNTADISYNLSKDASSVKILVYDRTGKIIASRDAGSQLAGDNGYVWDGKDSFGNQMPEGDYRYEIQAKDQSGNDVSVVTNSSGIVSSVSFRNGSTYLVLNGGRNIHLSEIQTIQ